MRSYGAKGLKAFIRHQVGLANQFRKLVSADERFQLPVEQDLGLVCFHLKVSLMLSIVICFFTLTTANDKYMLINKG
jgi:glutamate/tyrosine decarboxylase-like PLP-dependent enzyme